MKVNKKQVTETLPRIKELINVIYKGMSLKNLIFKTLKYN